MCLAIIWSIEDSFLSKTAVKSWQRITEMHLKKSSAKLFGFAFGLNMLSQSLYCNRCFHHKCNLCFISLAKITLISILNLLQWCTWVSCCLKSPATLLFVPFLRGSPLTKMFPCPDVILCPMAEAGGWILHECRNLNIKLYVTWHHKNYDPSFGW